MGMGGFSCRKNQKSPGAHKIGAAVSDPTIAGGKITDMRVFLIYVFFVYRFFFSLMVHPTPGALF